ncbi:uncharacterized protein LOC114366635 isoform X1 [Ostrinia furnacalis]|uniref:uncharacterized protein LOC114366635 isoform X1 n=2 Tax=Ostrinia furnacalis TaxID=93504 RepID=UPI00103DE084|nr:uncharacterized protein LOC114366635 isoform X1 [Ostrinia furnacalis]
MFLGMLVQSKTTIKALNRYSVILPHRLFSQALDNTYTEQQKEKILQVINEADNNMLSRYEIPKSRIKKVSQWKDTYGGLKSISDIHLIDGFSDKSAKKLFDSILDGPSEPPTVPKASSKIKGQILQPTLNESTRQKCRTVLAVYVSVNSVCWTLIDKENYEVVNWNYYGIDYPDGKRLQITDIMQIAWKVTHKLPQADIYVMKAEATTLRAGGSDPNNPKVIAVNLQKSQMISMIVALINARSNQITVAQDDEEEETSQIEKNFKHKVYFLRPSLPYRLYGTLVGNERVSTDQTVEMMLQNMSARSTENFLPKAYISEELKSDFRSRNELERDMLGHCLLLTLTFMDLCIYKNQESIQKLNKRGE